MAAKPKTLQWFWKNIFLTENLITEQVACPCQSGSHPQAASLQRSLGCMSQKDGCVGCLVQAGNHSHVWVSALGRGNPWVRCKWTEGLDELNVKEGKVTAFLWFLGENPPVSGERKVWHYGWFHSGYAAISDQCEHAKNTGKNNQRNCPYIKSWCNSTDFSKLSWL